MPVRSRRPREGRPRVSRARGGPAAGCGRGLRPGRSGAVRPSRGRSGSARRPTRDRLRCGKSGRGRWPPRRRGRLRRRHHSVQRVRADRELLRLPQRAVQPVAVVGEHQSGCGYVRRGGRRRRSGRARRTYRPTGRGTSGAVSRPAGPKAEIERWLTHRSTPALAKLTESCRPVREAAGGQHRCAAWLPGQMGLAGQESLFTGWHGEVFLDSPFHRTQLQQVCWV